jgi:hypothetical protein
VCFCECACACVCDCVCELNMCLCESLWLPYVPCVCLLACVSEFVSGLVIVLVCVCACGCVCEGSGGVGACVCLCVKVLVCVSVNARVDVSVCVFSQLRIRFCTTVLTSFEWFVCMYGCVCCCCRFVRIVVFVISDVAVLLFSRCRFTHSRTRVGFRLL